jgi:hypothetical protein
MLGRPASTAEKLRKVRQAPGLVERRQVHRIHAVCRFALVSRREDEGLWRVCNISDGGMMLKSDCRAEPEEPVAVSLSANVTLAATVLWSDSEHCGIRFREPVDSTALLCALATEQRSPRYRPLRLDVDGRALVFDEAGFHVVRVLNISRHGVGLGHDDRLRRGAAVRIVFETGGERRAVVRWADREQAGLFLLEPLSPDDMASARRFQTLPSPAAKDLSCTSIPTSMSPSASRFISSPPWSTS